MNKLKNQRERLVEILGLKLDGQNKGNLQLKQNFRLTLINQLNLITTIKQDKENKYGLSNANNINSPNYNMDLHFAGFNYWRKH